MSIYRLPRGQYGYSGHVINLPQDIPLFVSSLPRQPSDLDIVIIRKEGSGSNHRDFCVRRSKILAALQWLVTNNAYFSNITIDHTNLSALPENDHLANIPTISVDEPANAMEDQGYSGFSRTFVPSVHPTMTEEESIRQSLQSAAVTVTWPTRGQTPLNEFQCEGYFSCAFPTLFPTGAAEFLAPRLNNVTLGSY